MTPTIARRSPLFTELAIVLGRGYLRLTQNARKNGDSDNSGLDFWAQESPDRVDQRGDQECPKKPA